MMMVGLPEDMVDFVICDDLMESLNTLLSCHQWSEAAVDNAQGPAFSVCRMPFGPYE